MDLIFSEIRKWRWWTSWYGLKWHCFWN